ncbi:PTS-dependent dihydroxyacetone kinase phosphotransferase subunit DhaM [Streptobacillus moniliformis]|uniref:PTS system fructose subfamily IIA component n=1 Tax=Streptobacillus moniliformis (strain ATCC 14647 / DSM 12112 / NCTC 10651 / 9901) TaxID=519441 RepID=D1AYE2_STRM9|nr:PTS fructose subfamily transporter subunit IIA [Streptobacillus moniliformis]ACZ01318.1 PTS system fructose subfamily IIA component [Streptobacillus moniliformis DSM 12112]AVL43660.1 diguanylate cyclase [Streptobacillus moniliformis]QXW66054.1 diguanylate cyclase [Streptobacillus moniliformis]SQA13524.1 phosphotransferase mannnose-specific family component IIA [Streptobacillus moniliformis]
MKKETVGIVLVCHSNSMTDAFLEFCNVLKQEDFELLNGGGSNYDTYGTTPEIVADVIRKANRGKGVLVLVDFGSSINAVKGAIKLINGEIDVEIADCPLVEGTVSAIVANDENMNLKKLKAIAEDSINFKKIK